MRADDPRHGSVAGHSAGCRKPCCAAAKLRYDKARRFYGKRTVAALGTIRRIRALQALGWSFPAIAKAADLPYPTVTDPTTRGQNVYVSTAEGIRKAYDRLSMTLPEGGYAERNRRLAKRRGWLPPLAWDEGRMDDPNYNPMGSLTKTNVTTGYIDEAVVMRVLNGEQLRANKAERFEIMRRWLERGGSEAELCRRMGWKSGRYVGRKAQAGDVERRAS